MISNGLGNSILLTSLIAVFGAYAFVSRHEGSYLNILTPALIINVPASFLLPLAYNNLFGVEASAYAFAFVYATLAIESVVFAYFYTRPRINPIRLPFHFGYDNLGKLALLALGLSALMFAPILIEFREDILDPRRIYEQTRTGFGVTYYISSTCAYLTIILILFSKQSFVRKALIVLVSGILISLHGSKGQVLSVFFLLILFETYVNRRKLKLLHASLVGFGLALVLAGLFVATMALGSPLEAVETLSQYSDYTRNAMLVIDSNLPRQFGRLTFESNVLGLVPRVLVPSKPKNFGALYLDEEFYPDALDADKGAPAFGVGVQYADFGFLSIVYLGLFAAFKGWLASVFVFRLKQTRHPADFLMVAFLADVTVFPIGIGWLLPETLLVAMFLRYVSCFGARKIYHERIRRREPAPPQRGSESIEGLQGI
ncbi:MAG: hypothetical protein ABSG34_09990 [Candidatus Sulfotelmatobacter sp.]|jgi:hypothetical protein